MKYKVTCLETSQLNGGPTADSDDLNKKPGIFTREKTEKVLREQTYTYK